MHARSTMVELGTSLPSFHLPNVDGTELGAADFRQPVLLVMFLCNHCPYVKRAAATLAQIGFEYPHRGAGVVAINANDPSQNPADSPEQMIHEVELRHYSFPFLVDEDQEVAKAFRAACTPEFFVYGPERRLVYRGRLDANTPSSEVEPDGRELRMALDAALEGREIASEQTPSFGSSITWRKGAEPPYYSPIEIE